MKETMKPIIETLTTYKKRIEAGTTHEHYTSKDIIDCFCEIKLNNDDDFLKIKETLTRIGISSRKYNKQTITQTCHILHKCQKLYIVTFLEMFLLDQKLKSINNEDIKRRNFIANMLEQWGLCTLVDKTHLEIEGLSAKNLGLRIISFRDKDMWNLTSKYEIGCR